ncbi:MAG: MerR family DNA-binding transcriptional regulator [Solirubrobacterales bacterium]|jgi:DNA-binding transcriptional MerR regulator|nr:MerR family DNA-binding transcriptional regulator [Solirubrobacterales bacterium]
MEALTIHEAAQTTGWTPRMLRYIERIGLIEPARTESGYRQYGAGELQRLRTLRELLAEHEIGLGDVAFALRLRRDEALDGAVDSWLEAEPQRPETVSADEWLRWEQEKHARIIAALTTNETMETAA